MTRFAAAVAILGVALGCASPAPASPDPASEIALHVGEKAQVQGGELVVTFVGVTQDSRCPKGEQCITAGKAVVNLEATPRGESPVAFQLDTSSAYEHEIVGLRIGLVSLDPLPVSGRPISPADYVARLTVHRP